MNDQAQMMNQSQQLPIMQSHRLMNNQNSQMLMNQLINPSLVMMNQSQSQGMLNNRGGRYGMWPPALPEQLKFQNPNTKPSGFVPSSSKPMGPRNNKNWKGKKGNDKRNNNNWNELGNVGVGNYNPPTLKELQQQNRLKARRYFSKKKHNHGGKSAPFAPRNTTSFLIRAKKAGGITSLVSPCPVTPSVLPTPIFSPSREVLVDMAKEEWGVDGYGSMKGLIRLRSPGNDEEDEEGGSSESDVEEHLEVERRLDHDLSRFEMIYPNHGGADHNSYLLENRVDDQDTHIAQLEEENLILKERLFLMEREFDNLRKRLQSLERGMQGGQGFMEEVVVENDSENDSGSRGYGRSVEDTNELMEENDDGNGNQSSEPKESNNGEKGLQEMEVLKDVGLSDVHKEDNIVKNEEKIDVEIEDMVEVENRCMFIFLNFEACVLDLLASTI
ncbi:unnamed protein product [Lactuca saligna]|uniref:PRLI-interacting factor A n=1 Tax=Lactuca saligna TaxID=75948 RepID=A0AA35ZDW3_LACSI|nr:unnamed protein product [Lactuca saligna]